MKRLLRKLQYGDDCVDLEEFVTNSYNVSCWYSSAKKNSKCFATRYYAFTFTCTCFWELLKK